MMSPDEIDYSDICLQRENPQLTHHHQNLNLNSKLLSTSSPGLFKDSRLINKFRPSQESLINGFSTKNSQRSCSTTQQELLIRLHAQALLSQQQNQMIQSPNAHNKDLKYGCQTSDLGQLWNGRLQSQNSPQNDFGKSGQMNMFQHQFQNEQSPDNPNGKVFVTASWPKSHKKEEKQNCGNEMAPLQEVLIEGSEEIHQKERDIIVNRQNMSPFQNQNQIENNYFPNEIEIQKTETSKILNAGNLFKYF